MSMADTIVLMEKGAICQEAAPEVMYADPQHIFTAQFIGTPPMNMVKTTDENLCYGFRPEAVRMTGQKTQDILSLRATIVTREMLGSETNYQMATSLGRFMVKSACAALGADGQPLYINVDLEHLYIFSGEGYRIQPYFNNFGEYVSRIERCIHENA